MKLRVFGQPLRDVGMPVGAVVVTDHVDLQSWGHFAGSVRLGSGWTEWTVLDRVVMGGGAWGCGHHSAVVPGHRFPAEIIAACGFITASH